jgi:hypothetical protein
MPTAKSLIKSSKRAFGDGKVGADSGFHLGGFALGILLGLIGVLLAYVVFNDDNKQARIKWSWIGVGVLVAIALLSFVF